MRKQTALTRRSYLLLMTTALVAACAPAATSPTAAPASAPTAAAPASTQASAPAAAPTTAAATTAPAAPTTAPATAPTQAVAPASASASSGQITVVQAADPPSLDPAQNLVQHVFNIGQNVLDTLAYLDRQMKVQPRLATEWKNIDTTTWEVKLRSGVKFHDGTPFDANVVKASFDYQVAPTTSSKTFFLNWAAIDVVDPTTIRVKTKAADPFFANVLTRLWIFSPNDVKNPSTLSTKLNGTGAYKLIDFVKGDHITLQANPSYWGTAPKIAKIIFRSASENSTRVAMLQSGQADLIVNLPVEQIPLFKSNSKVRVDAIQGLRGVPIMIDARTGPPLTDVRVRQAMNYAVDKQSIIKNILGGYAVEQPATISSLIAGHNPNIKPYAFDPAKAKQLLSEAGVAKGFTIDFHYSNGRWLKDAEVAQAMAQMLGNVGIKCNLVTVEYSTYFTQWSKGQYKGMSMIGVTNPDGAPNSLYNLFFYSKGAWPYSVTDPKLDTMIEQARTTIDPVARNKDYQDMEQYVHNLAPWIFTYEQKGIYGVNSALKWEPAPNGALYFWDASF